MEKKASELEAHLEHLGEVLRQHKDSAKQPWKPLIKKKILAVKFQIDEYYIDLQQLVAKQVRLVLGCPSGKTSPSELIDTHALPIGRR